MFNVINEFIVNKLGMTSVKSLYYEHWTDNRKYF